MKILYNTEYVDLSKQTEPWYQLSVTNYQENAVCFKKINGSTIYYALKKRIPTGEKSYKSEHINTLTLLMMHELKGMGYTIKKI